MTLADAEGALSNTLSDLKQEAKSHLKCNRYFADATNYDNSGSQAERAVQRVADFKLSGAELAALYECEIDNRQRLAGVQPSKESNCIRWAAFASVLGPEESDHEAGGAEYSEAVEAIAKNWEAREKQKEAEKILARAEIISAADLRGKEFPPPRWAVPGLVPEGLSLLSGGPKLGKSWFALSVCRAVAAGTRALGKINTEKGSVAYLSLEDSAPRLQRRLEQLGDEFPPLLTLITKTPDPLLKVIDAYTLKHKDARLVVVDTLGRALPTDFNKYNAVTEVLAPLQRLALERHIGILLIHHTRKISKGQSGGDVFETPLGSTAIFGVMDATLLLTKQQRGQNTGTLAATGRDFQDVTYSLEQSPETMEWTISDDLPEEVAVGPERREILGLLKAAPQPMKTGEVAKAIHKANSTTSEHLKKLEELGVICSVKTGYWEYIKHAESPESAESTYPVCNYSDETIISQTESAESLKNRQLQLSEVSVLSVSSTPVEAVDNRESLYQSDSSIDSLESQNDKQPTETAKEKTAPPGAWWNMDKTVAQYF